ncbi:serine O-acetyltransferase [Clostridium pasteurianum]|uniref:Serine acetyltransferase n=1 Tax=Clostridium pasteurianum BC1 TaxID=86416 RepID=R4K8C3_CLOPA|nr:serine acetyltransferase [Clostridium pasteurianum]AGK95890.1 serine acetyltransferase [Clostridium pasteurianum BC1]
MREKDILRYNIYADFYRAYGAKVSKKQILKLLFRFSNQGPKYIFYMRLANYFKKTNKNLFRMILSIHLNRMSVKHGVEISYKSKIGEGLSIPHFNNIIMGENVVIGKNCTILQGTTIGSNLFKSRYKIATIGDNVLIGAGAKIIGPITIGNNVTIGANSVVTTDIPNDVVIAGSPAKIISYKPAIEIGTDYKKFDEFIKK